ncbi:MAG: FAD-dependent oxidoreductase [Bryobacteraceae bacterium]
MKRSEFLSAVAAPIVCAVHTRAQESVDADVIIYGGTPAGLSAAAAVARAGVSHRYGRESKEQYGESLAGTREPHFKTNYREEIYRTPGIEYMHHGQFGADIPSRVGGNRSYPDGDHGERDRIYRDHYDYQSGFLWFLAHDPRVPKIVRDDVNSWGLSKDEYPNTSHWPAQLYIREARRLIGEHVMTEHDILQSKTKRDSAGMGSFVLDSHWVQRFENKDGFVRIEGHLDESIRLEKNPYEIPYRSLTPKRSECRNLLVPVCVSATHVAMCTIRMEPVYMVLGHSAGVAAVVAVRKGQAVQDVDISDLVTRLSEQGQVLHKEQARSI